MDYQIHVSTGNNNYENVSTPVPKLMKIINDYINALGVLVLEDAEGNRSVNAYNFNHLTPYDGKYRYTDETSRNHPFSELYLAGSRTFNDGTIRNYYITGILLNADDDVHLRQNRVAQKGVGPPRLRWRRDGEDRTIEIPDRFFYVMPQETAEGFAARLQDELTFVAKTGIEKLSVINDIPLLLSRSSDYTSSLATNPHNESLRNAITGFKACIGYLQSELDANTMTDATEDAINTLYALYHTLHTADESGAEVDYYNMIFGDPKTAWATAYTEQKVYLPTFDGTPGDLLIDVKDIDAPAGKIAPAAATAKYEGYATTDFETAYFHIDQNHGQPEDMVIEEYLPDYRNDKLSTLKVWINDEASGTLSEFTETFDPDRETHVTAEVWNHRDTIFIEAVAESSDAVITGAGLIDAHIGPNTVNVTVTSQDGVASRTYIIYTVRYT